MTDQSKPLALVTGVGPGTGAAVARRFADSGYRVAMLARDAERLAALEKEIPDSIALPCDVTDVAALLRLSRATMANIRQNVAIALGLKGVFLVSTVLGLTGLWIAILADTGATVLVTLNALRLLGFRPGGR